jgi:trans-aconitate 2-methyltransferase
MVGMVDVVVANAVFHWVPGHAALFERFVGWLAPGGTLAFQVPANFDQPSHRAISELSASPRWHDRLAGVNVATRDAVLAPADYLGALAGLGLRVDAWETTYLHVLEGPDPVLEWVKGTALRPVLTALDETEQGEFCAELGEVLRAAYPPTPYGTVFPFRRIFVVASR